MPIVRYFRTFIVHIPTPLTANIVINLTVHEKMGERFSSIMVLSYGEVNLLENHRVGALA